MTTTGFAAVNQRGVILVNTVSETRRAAMVNWLVVHARLSVYQHDTDQKIADNFTVAAEQRGLATIEEVTISMLATEKVEPDWPPAASAVGLKEGVRWHGSTGQCFEVKHGRWERVR